jgi:hypothetical protein
MGTRKNVIPLTPPPQSLVAELPGLWLPIASDIKTQIGRDCTIKASKMSSYDKYQASFLIVLFHTQK